MVLAGGGTGGHVYPTLAVLDVLRDRFNEAGLPHEITRMGPRDGYEPLFESRGVVMSPIIAGKLRRYASIMNIIDAPKFFIGLLQALWKLYVIMPDVIFSKGGTGALPVVIAGWFYRIPIAIHESDAKPGLTNLFSARFARKIFLSFPDAAPYFDPGRTTVTGAPVRAKLLGVLTAKLVAKETLGFSGGQPLLLVLGGSQGSARINDFMLANLTTVIKETQVLHQTGIANFAEVQKLSHAALIDESFKTRYEATGYFETDSAMLLALTAADLVISRAGSSSIFEIAAFGLPAILMPLAESANDHQRTNAYAFAKTGGAIVIEESNFIPGIVLPAIKRLLENPGEREKMAAASSSFFVPGAAEKIAQALIELGAGI